MCDGIRAGSGPAITTFTVQYGIAAAAAGQRSCVSPFMGEETEPQRGQVLRFSLGRLASEPCLLIGDPLLPYVVHDALGNFRK